MRQAVMLPPYGRPGVTSGAPTDSRARFWRRGDIHVARMTHATVADGFPGRTTDFRLQRLRCAVPAPGVTSGAPTRSRRRFWRRGDIYVARMTDAHTRRAGTIAYTRRAVMLPPYGRPGVTSGAPTGCGAVLA